MAATAWWATVREEHAGDSVLTAGRPDYRTQGKVDTLQNNDLRTVIHKYLSP